MEVHFEVLGKPIGKGRPKFSRIGNYVKTYTPEQTTNYENLVRLSYQQQVGAVKLEGSINASMTFYFPIPKSVTKKVREQMLAEKYPHSKKPDLDNCIKAIADSLNGIAFDDDSQICSVISRKLYSDNPRAVVILQEYGE